MMENMLDAENVAPNAVGARVAPPPRARIALTPRARARSALQGAKKASKAKGDKTIEEIYQKKTPLEHILCRPDTYVGSTEQQYDRVRPTPATQTQPTGLECNWRPEKSVY